MLHMLAEEVEDRDNPKPNPDYEAMYNRMDEIRSSYALLYREETLATYKSRNEMIEEDDKEQAEDGSEKLNEVEDMKCASGGTRANWSEEVKTKDYGSIQGSNDEEKSEYDESAATNNEEEWEDNDDNDDDKEEDKEDVEFAASKLREENIGKRLPSALRSKKVGPIQSNSKRSNETEDTGQESQARTTQGEVILTESRAEND